MRAREEVAWVWHRFGRYPMETLTKAWAYKQTPGARQRDVYTSRLKP